MVFSTAFFLVLGIVFIATLVRSAVGFGDSLIAMPLLVWVIGLQQAAPLVALIAFTIAGTILLRQWKRLDIAAVWRLVVASFLGLPLGLWLLKYGSEAWISALLGVVLIGFGLYNLVRPKWEQTIGVSWAWGFGFVAGILGGAYNINGPPAVMYASLRQWPPEQFRASMQGFFFPSGCSILIGHALTDLWTIQMFHTYLAALPLVFLAIFLGGLLNRRFSTERFHKFVYALLIIMGIALLF